MVRLGEDKWQYSVLLTATMVGGCRPRVRQRRRTAHPLLMLLLLLRRSVSTAVRQSEPGGSQPNASYIHVQYMCYMCIAHVSHTYYDMCIAQVSYIHLYFTCISHICVSCIAYVSPIHVRYTCCTCIAHKAAQRAHDRRPTATCGGSQGRGRLTPPQPQLPPKSESRTPPTAFPHLGIDFLNFHISRKLTATAKPPFLVFIAPTLIFRAHATLG